LALSIGTDIVKVDRFSSWKNFSKKQFLRVFLENELEDCKKDGMYDFVRLAARFAAKEAFFKALSSALVKLGFTKNEFSFLFLCKNVEISKTTWGVPVLKIDWSVLQGKIGQKLPEFEVELSLSHEKDYAVAFVVLGEKGCEEKN